VVIVITASTLLIGVEEVDWDSNPFKVNASLATLSKVFLK
jgi:hypothetical protein